MIHIDSQRECEIKYNNTNKEIIQTTDVDIMNIDQTIADNLTQENTLNSPSSFLSSPSFNKRLSSQKFSQYSAQFCAKNLQSNIHQINNNTNIPCSNILQDSNSDKQQQNPTNNNVKNPNILSPTPFKAINLTQSMLNNSTSHSLASSSSSSSSSQASSYSYISASSQKKEQQKNKVNDWQSKSFSQKKIMLVRNLYHSDDEQDYCDQEENQCFQQKICNQNILSLSKSKNINKQENQLNKNNHHQHPYQQRQHQRCQYYQEDDYEEIQNDTNYKDEQNIKTISYFQNQITRFILEENNNKSNTANNNTPAQNNNNTNIANSDQCCKKISQPNFSYYSQSAPQQFISSNEIDSDELISLANSIERTQNPQSKDEEFLNLNSSSFTEDTFEQFKEFLLSEHLDKSF